MSKHFAWPPECLQRAAPPTPPSLHIFRGDRFSLSRPAVRSIEGFYSSQKINEQGRRGQRISTKENKDKLGGAVVTKRKEKSSGGGERKGCASENYTPRFKNTDTFWVTKHFQIFAKLQYVRAEPMVIKTWTRTELVYISLACRSGTATGEGQQGADIVGNLQEGSSGDTLMGRAYLCWDQIFEYN